MPNTKNPLLVVCALFLLLLSIFTARTAISDTFNIIREGIVRDLQGIADKQAEIITEYMENQKKNIRVAAYDLHRYYAKSDFFKALEYLISVQNIYHYREVFVANTAGNVVLSTEVDNIETDIFSTEDDNTGTNIFSRQYFKKAISGETFISDITGSVIPIKNEEGQLELGMPTMFVSTPILDANAQILGVLVFRINIDQINKLMFRMKATRTGEIYLINKNGYMLTDSRYTDTLKIRNLVERRTTLELQVVNPRTNNLTYAARNCITEGEGFNDHGYMDYRGMRVIGYWIWMTEYNLGIIAEIDLAEAFEDIRKYFQSTTIKNLRGIMRQQISLIKNRMDKFKNNALSIARKPQSLQYTEGTSSIDEYITALDYLEFLRDEYNYKGIFICNSEGIVKLSTEKRLLGKDISKEDYVVKAKENDVFITDIRHEITFGRKKRDLPTMLISAQIKNNAGDFAGTVILRVDLDDFNKLMHSTEIGESGEIYLVNTEGFLVTESRFVNWLKKKGMITERTTLELKGINPETGMLTKAIDGCMDGEGFCQSEYYDYRGVLVLGAWDWISEYKWGIVVEIDLEEAFRRSSSFWGIKQYF